MTDSSTLLKEINNFLRYRKGHIGGFDQFRNSGLYEHHANLFGHLTYTEDLSINYIGVDKDGYLYDETYYPYEGIEKVGTIVPIHLYEQNNYEKINNVDPIWKEVAEKGFAIIDSIPLPDELQKSCMEEGFIPHGYNSELELPKTIYHSYFDPLKELEPEKVITKKYLQDSTDYLISRLPSPQPFIKNWVMTTANLKKYIYDEKEIDCNKGAYSFHMDYFPRCLFMFFTYLSNSPDIKGRELLVGQRDDFLDFSAEAVDLSPDAEPSIENPFGRLTDDRILNYEKIPIAPNKIIIMNTLNPMFVHKVLKLKSKDDVLFLSNYIWCKFREFTD